MADGELLGIEGAEQVMPDPATTAPTLSIRTASGGFIEVVWQKGPFDGVKLEVDRGDGFKYLATDTVPNYVDTFRPAPGTSAVYRYRAIYLLRDDEYGQWSNVAEATTKA